MARKLTTIDRFAQKLICQCDRPIYPGEYEYVSTAATLIESRMQSYFMGSGGKPPRRKTIVNWFYTGCPDWAIAVMMHEIGL